MLNNRKSAVSFIIILMIIVVSSCNEKKTQNSEIEISQEQKYKVWLKDTLQSIGEKQGISVGSDSLTLNITKRFSINSDDLDNKNKICNSIISTLKEFGELPIDHYVVSFVYDQFFYPSPILDLQKEMTYEISDINLKTDNGCVCKYLFNRGEFTSRTKYCGDSIIEKVEFTKQDSEIIKTKI